jgi:hypothetical protein
MRTNVVAREPEQEVGAPRALMVVFGDISIAQCRAMQKKSRFSNKLRLVFCESLAWTMLGQYARLTYPAMGSMMKFGARHLHWYWRRTSFQKDDGHTES